MQLYILSLNQSCGTGGIDPVDFRTVVHITRDRGSLSPGVESVSSFRFDSGRHIWFARKKDQLIPLIEKCIS